MSRSPQRTSEQPHLVALVLKSKIALQQGEKLCTHANALTNASAQCVLDVLALDAKVRWITGAVSEQLKLAAAVAKTLEQKRAEMHKQLNDWERLKTRHSDGLDAVLDSLGSQVVPPDLHQPLSDSDLFGSQHSDEEDGPQFPPPSPTSTLRETLVNGRHKAKQDRRRWKTLRDFVDERAIEDVYESMEIDRSALEKAIDPTDENSETLQAAISAIQNSLPTPTPLPSIEDMINAQDIASSLMAGNLESLASHYGQMAEALHDGESGETFSDEDLAAMNRDTNELPAVVAELEENMMVVESQHDRLLQSRAATQVLLDALPAAIDDLDELGEIMTDMLDRQRSIEVDCQDRLENLQDRLLTIEELRKRYVAYHHSFNKLLVEISRRQVYMEAAGKIVEGMMSQLDAMVQEERAVRAEFNAEHRAYMPDDLSLSIETFPTRWEISPGQGESPEGLPKIDPDLLIEAKEKISGHEGVQRSQSLSS